MPREHSDLQKHTLNLYRGDMDELQALFPQTPPSVLVRELVRSCIKNAKAADPEVKKLDLPLNI